MTKKCENCYIEKEEFNWDVIWAFITYVLLIYMGSMLLGMVILSFFGIPSGTDATLFLIGGLFSSLVGGVLFLIETMHDKFYVTNQIPVKCSDVKHND